MYTKKIASNFTMHGMYKENISSNFNDTNFTDILKL